MSKTDCPSTSPGPLSAPLEYPPTDAWEAFFRCCWRASEALRQRRAAKTAQDAEPAQPTTEPPAEAQTT